MVTLMTRPTYYPYREVKPFFYAARVEGELCGRDKDVVLTPVWLNSITGDSSNGPNVWTKGNMLVVSPGLSNDSRLLAPCDPGILTVTATLDGVAIGSPITLALSIYGSYYG